MCQLPNWTSSKPAHYVCCRLLIIRTNVNPESRSKGKTIYFYVQLVGSKLGKLAPETDFPVNWQIITPVWVTQRPSDEKAAPISCQAPAIDLKRLALGAP